MLRDLTNASSIARILATPVLGALLDSIADLLLLFTSFYAVWAFHPQIVWHHWPGGTVLIGAWLVECVAAPVRYGRLSSFHTYLSKVADYLLGIFVGVLFVVGFQLWLLYLAVVYVTDLVELGRHRLSA